jgi:hypothetical protein
MSAPCGTHDSFAKAGILASRALGLPREHLHVPAALVAVLAAVLLPKAKLQVRGRRGLLGCGYGGGCWMLGGHKAVVVPELWRLEPGTSGGVDPVPVRSTQLG